MLKLFLLLIAVVCCNACRLEMVNSEDTTNGPLTVCSDSYGNPHDIYSEWENGPETCVCVDFGIICCERYWETTVPNESTRQIIGDNFGAFTWNDGPNRPDSSDSPEVIGDYFGAFTENDGPNEVSNQPEVIADYSYDSDEGSA